MKYEVRIRPSAEKELLRLEKRDYTMLRRRLESLAENPRAADAIKLRTKSYWRVRAGRFRIIYDIAEESKSVEVVRITRRSEGTYKGL